MVQHRRRSHQPERVQGLARRLPATCTGGRRVSASDAVLAHAAPFPLASLPPTPMAVDHTALAAIRKLRLQQLRQLLLIIQLEACLRKSS